VCIVYFVYFQAKSERAKEKEEGRGVAEGTRRKEETRDREREI